MSGVGEVEEDPSTLTVGAYLLASLGRTSSLPADVGPFLGVIIGLLVIAHVATRRLAPNADGTLLPLAALLNGLGYVFIARLDHKLAGLQAIWTALGVAAYIGTLWVVRRSRVGWNHSRPPGRPLKMATCPLSRPT